MLTGLYGDGPSLGREIDVLHLLAVRLPLLFGSSDAWLLERRSILKSNRKGAGRNQTVAMQRKDQREVKKALSPDQIGMKGRRKRILLPESRADLLTGLVGLCVVHGDGDGAPAHGCRHGQRELQRVASGSLLRKQIAGSLHKRAIACKQAH